MKSNRYRLLAAVMLLLVSNVNAKTWTINVRPTATGGYVYTMGGTDLSTSAASFNATVGDTIDYEMPFTAHNLGIFNQGGTLLLNKGFNPPSFPGGTSIKFVVPAAGGYGFACSFHSNLTVNPPTGMVAAFTATAAGASVSAEANNTLRFESIFPNPASNMTMVDFELTEPAHVKLMVFDATGKLVMTALDENMSAGMHMPTIDTKGLASGSYQYVLQAGDAVLRRQAIIVK